MKNVLSITNIILFDNIIKYECDFNGDWINFISKDDMFVRYDFDVTKLPKSIAVIPFIANILPISWVYDLEIRVPVLDRCFYDHIDMIKKGYEKMYPYIEFKGNIIVEELVQNSFQLKNKAVMFSGGVDAFNTFYNHIDDSPDLITVFGADISLSDKAAIDDVISYHSFLADKYNLNFCPIYSNFRDYVLYDGVNSYISSKYKLEWWHDFHHGLALLGLSAPLAFINNYFVVYIASSFTSSDIGNYTCASDPLIDNNFAHSSSITIHDGYEFNRQDKIFNISKFLNDNNDSVNIRVCWDTKGSQNCCECEKCYRTILGIIASGNDPKLFGFNLSYFKKKRMINFLKIHLKYSNNICTIPRYSPIITFLKNNNIKLDNDFSWLYDLELLSYEPSFGVKILIKVYSLDSKIRRIIRRHF